MRSLAATLVTIGLIAAALRVIGLGWGLPFAMHPDEPLILDIAERMSWGDMNPDFFHYPGFFIYQVFLLRQLVVAFGGDYVELLYAARFLSAAYGLLTVGIVYLLGARLGDRRLGVLAALLVAVMGALTLQSHYAVTDTAAAALVTVAIWLSVRGWQHRRFGELIGATAIAGLAVSTKYSVAPICFVPWAAAMALGARRGMPYARRGAATIGLAAIAVAAFLAASPYTVLDHEAFARDLSEEVALQAQDQAGEHSDPLLDATVMDRGVVGNVVGMYRDMGPAALAMAIGTMILLVAGLLPPLRGAWSGSGVSPSAVGDLPGRSGEDPAWSGSSAFERLTADPVASLLPVLWVVLYFAIMAPSAKFGERYLVPLYPTLMVFAAVPVWGALLAETGYGRRPARALALVALLVAAAPPAVDAVGSTRLLAQRDSRLVARDWAIENLPAGSRLAREFYAPPFSASDGFRLLQPFSLTDLSFTAYCADGVDYLLLSSLNRDRYRSDPSRYAERLGWHDQLDANTRLVRRIEGDGELLRHHPTIEIRHLFCRDDGAPRP